MRTHTEENCRKSVAHFVKLHFFITEMRDLHFLCRYSCQLCRPHDALPPHLALQTPEEREKRAGGGGNTDSGVSPTPHPSPEYPVYGGFYNNSSYLLDGVMLSERGMQV